MQLCSSVLQGPGPLTVTEAVSWQHFLPGWEVGVPTEGSLRMFSLSASTSLGFLSFSALISLPFPVPFNFFVSVLLSIRSLSATQGNRQKRPENSASNPWVPGAGRATERLTRIAGDL